MAEFSIRDLSWLRPAAEDFRAQVKALSSAEAIAGADLMALANHALNADQLLMLAKRVDKVRDRITAPPLSPLKLALIAEGTTDYTAPAIAASALRHGVLAEVYIPSYGLGVQEVMDPTSDLAAFGADVALVSQDYRALGLGNQTMDPAAAAAAVTAALARVTALVDGLNGQGIRSIIVETVAAPPEPWCGHFDRRAPGSVAAQCRAFNDRLAALSAERALMLLDVAEVAGLVGATNWFDHAYWHRAKLPFAMDYVPLYGDHVGRILGAMRGKAKKCLVLDLDNTCWGGIIGDDGLEGIKIGQGSAEGEAFLAIQRYALDLKARGVVLAVCSKNEEDAARLPFQKHPDMALREDDIAVFVANWTDKASNIRNIAKTLNIGVDALAFLDDNPAERERVRQELPEVAVPELPEDPAWYPAALAQGGYFETVALSADDAKRAEQYRANAQRAVAMDAIGNYDDYLASLDMSCDISAFDSLGRARIAQLVNKSNQFNLTTRRYTEAEVAAMEADDGIFDMQIRLTDKFGDNGMISVVIFRKGAEEWVCDSWLMSCRVLKRRVEEAALAAVVEAAKAAGAKRLVGDYLPSPKNRMVAGHFETLGFTAAGAVGEDGTRWVLEIDSFDSTQPLPMVLTGALAPISHVQKAAE